MMKRFAPAKINLSLKILGKRADGFHEIETIVAPLGLADEIEIEQTENSGIDCVCDEPSIPADNRNLAVRAARIYLERTGCERGARIHLRKRIPHGAGLGGGSSDAAAVLLALNEMAVEPLSSADLADAAAEIGSDVPLFLAGKPVRCTGRGEIICTLEKPIPDFPLLLLKPPFEVSTAEAYANWRDAPEFDELRYEPQRIGDLQIENDLERPVFAKYPFLCLMKNWLLGQNEVRAALMSGSGSTLFAILKSSAAADSLAARARGELDPQMWSWSGSLKIS